MRMIDEGNECSMNEKKVALFIDDDKCFLDTLKEVVAHPQFEIQTYHARNGYHVIDEVIKRKPYALFIDFNLPRANGSQIIPVIKQVKKLSSMPVYFVTGYAEKEVNPLLKDVQHSGILKKDDTLISVIVKMLNKLAS
jgi:CheY-like chemotaxis protein